MGVLIWISPKTSLRLRWSYLKPSQCLRTASQPPKKSQSFGPGQGKAGCLDTGLENRKGKRITAEA